MIWKKVSASTNDIFGGRPFKLHRIQLVATADSTVTCYDAITAATKDFAYRSATGGTQADMSWGSDALALNNLSVTMTGSGAVIYIYYE
jgi:hypothetical protein